MNTLLTETRFACGQTLQLVQGDLTAETTEAIVNAANKHLQHGGGVAWAIVRRGGEVIQRESEEWVRTHGPVSHAEPAWTSGGALPAKYVIHAVGPVWDGTHRAGAGSDETSLRALSRADAKLAAAVTGSLSVVDRLGLASIAMPALSTGIFGFPKERAAGIIVTAVRDYFDANPASGVNTVRLVLYNQLTVEIFRRIWHDHFSA